MLRDIDTKKIQKNTKAFAFLSILSLWIAMDSISAKDHISLKKEGDGDESFLELNPKKIKKPKKQNPKKSKSEIFNSGGSRSNTPPMKAPADPDQ